MYNRVIMMGRLVTDPELKSTPQGVNVCSFRIAVDRRFQKQGEERKSDFFNVVAWRQQGEFVNRYFSKGRMILVEGEMTTRNYTDKNGNPATWYEIVADRISFTGEKSQGGSYNDYAASAAAGEPVPASSVSPTPAAPQSAGSEFHAAPPSDDYPF